MGQSTEELTRDIEGTRQNLAADLDALQDRVSPQAIIDRRKAAARGRVASLKDRVMGTAQSARHSAGSSASGMTDSARSTASGAVDSVQGAASDAADTASERFQGSPLAAGLMAFGAGMVLSALLPASDKEAKAAAAVMDTAQPLVDQARSAGQDLGQDLAATAQEAAEQVKQTATEAASRVQEEGVSSADAVRSQAQG